MHPRTRNIFQQIYNFERSYDCKRRNRSTHCNNKWTYTHTRNATNAASISIITLNCNWVTECRARRQTSTATPIINATDVFVVSMFGDWLATAAKAAVATFAKLTRNQCEFVVRNRSIAHFDGCVRLWRHCAVWSQRSKETTPVGMDGRICSFTNRWPLHFMAHNTINGN